MNLRHQTFIDLSEYERSVLRAIATRKPANWQTSAEYRIACVWLKECGLIRRPRGFEKGGGLNYMPTERGLQMLQGANK